MAMGMAQAVPGTGGGPSLAQGLPPFAGYAHEGMGEIELESQSATPGGQVGDFRRTPPPADPISMEYALQETMTYIGFLLRSEDMSRRQSPIYDWLARGPAIIQSLQTLVDDSIAARLRPADFGQSPSGVRQQLADVMYPSQSGALRSGRATMYLQTAPPESSVVEVLQDGTWRDVDSDRGSPAPGDTPRMMQEQGLFRTPSPVGGSPGYAPQAPVGVLPAYSPADLAGVGSPGYTPTAGVGVSTEYSPAGGGVSPHYYPRSPPGFSGSEYTPGVSGRAQRSLFRDFTPDVADVMIDYDDFLVHVEEEVDEEVEEDEEYEE